MNGSEPILQFKKRGSQPHRDNRHSEWMQLVREPWVMAPKNVSGKHEAAFPDELPRRCIVMCSLPGDVVMDPFAGTGTVGLVCKAEGRQCVLIEQRAEYIDESLRFGMWVHRGTTEHHTAPGDMERDFSGEYVIGSDVFRHFGDGEMPLWTTPHYSRDGKTRSLFRGNTSALVTVDERQYLKSTFDIGTSVLHSIFCYIITHDTNLAPCVHNGVLTLALCKPAIRREAEVGDVIVAFASGDAQDPVGRIAYVISVGKTYKFEKYMAKDDGSRKLRPDMIYRRRRDECEYDTESESGISASSGSGGSSSDDSGSDSGDEAGWVHRGIADYHTAPGDMERDFSGKFVIESVAFKHFGVESMPFWSTSHYSQDGKTRSLFEGHTSEMVTPKEKQFFETRYGIVTNRLQRIFCYVIQHDANIAPCIHNDILTMALCNPDIRREAKSGDVIVAFASGDAVNPVGRIVYVIGVTRTHEFETYMALDDDDAKMRPDMIYRRQSDEDTASEGDSNSDIDI